MNQISFMWDQIIIHVVEMILHEMDRWVLGICITWIIFNFMEF